MGNSKVSSEIKSASEKPWILETDVLRGKRVKLQGTKHHGLGRGDHGRQRLVFHFDLGKGFFKSILIFRSHRRYWLSGMENAIHGHYRVIRRSIRKIRASKIGLDIGEVLASENSQNTGDPPRFSRLYRNNTRVSVRAAENLAWNHSWNDKISGKLRRSGYFFNPIYTSCRRADNPQRSVLPCQARFLFLLAALPLISSIPSELPGVC